MTFREKLMKDYPQQIDSRSDGGCRGCPCSYGYESNEEADENCKRDEIEDCWACWDREMPERGERERHSDHRNHGHWIKHDKGAGIAVVCSVCRNGFHSPLLESDALKQIYHYCPNCGTKMDED